MFCLKIVQRLGTRNEVPHYIFVSKVKMIRANCESRTCHISLLTARSRSCVKAKSNYKENSGIKIITGEPVIDRKSKFLGHFAVVTSTEDVQWVIDELKQDKKIASATHNISAWRISNPNGSMEENRDDDGESGAGDKLLLLLQRLKAVNVLVVVTRWYGGIQLGPDRFKHITSVALNLVKPYVEGNLI